MNLSLSDYNLVMSFCDTYNLSSLDADYTAWASSIRYVYTEATNENRWSYIKDLKWSRNKKHDRPWLFERVAQRVCLNKRTDRITIEDMYNLERVIKSKYGMSHCNHSCYSLSRLFRSVECQCCGSDYYISRWYSMAELGESICSHECSVINRLCKRLSDLYQRRLISRSFKIAKAKADNNLHVFLNYLANQNTNKRKRKNKGKFTWG